MGSQLSNGIRYDVLKKEETQKVRGEFGRPYMRSLVQALLASKDGKLQIESPAIQIRRKDLFPMFLNFQVITHHISDNSVTFESQRAARFARSISSNAK
jgi:hypothetical protein